MLILLDQPLPLVNDVKTRSVIPFKEHIILKNVSFRYTNDTPWILKDVNLRLKRGNKIGIVGVTGSGKSTLLDILMGLLSPTCGQLLVDGTPITETNRGAWQAHIAHVPQSIFLADSTGYQGYSCRTKGTNFRDDR